MNDCIKESEIFNKTQLLLPLVWLQHGDIRKANTNITNLLLKLWSIDKRIFLIAALEKLKLAFSKKEKKKKSWKKKKEK